MTKYSIQINYNGSNIFNGTFDATDSGNGNSIVTAFYDSNGTNIFVNNGYVGQNNVLITNLTPLQFSNGGVNITSLPSLGNYPYFNLYSTGTIWGLDAGGVHVTTYSAQFVISQAGGPTFTGDGTSVKINGNDFVQFVSAGTITFASTTTAQILMVAGGGGGGGGLGPSYESGGGGGAGGVADGGFTFVGGTTYTITVGAGGSGGNGAVDGQGNATGGSSGGDTTIAQSTTIVARVYGGGRGGHADGTTNAQNGGSGGGGPGWGSGFGGVISGSGSGLTQRGNNGGSSADGGGNCGAGGGGASSAGGNGNATDGNVTASGGNGFTWSYTSATYGGGGGPGISGTSGNPTGGSGGAGGSGGGGRGAGSSVSAVAGTNGTGGGGGGGAGNTNYRNGASGGSGIVLINYVSSVTTGSAPTSVTASVASSTSIQISYGASTGGVPAVSAYYYTLNGGSYTSASASPFTISGLSPGGTYSVVMYAYNASWPTQYVASSTSNSVTTYNTGSAPTSVTASVASSTSIQISYGESTGGVPAVSAYYYTLNGGSYTSASASPFTISGLSPGGTYSVVMYAYNASWPTQYVASSTSNSVTTYNTGSAPSITSATPSTNSISVSFNLSTGGVPALPTTTPTDGTLQVNGYYYSINAGVTKYNAGISSPITISGLNSNTLYNILIYAYHTSWPTQFSAAATTSATTLAIVIGSSYYFASSTDLTSKFPTLLNSSSNNVPNTAYLTNLANPINKCMLYTYGTRNSVGFKINGNDIGGYFQQDSITRAIEAGAYNIGPWGISQSNLSNSKWIWNAANAASSDLPANVYIWFYYTFYYSGAQTSGTLYAGVDNVGVIYFNGNRFDIYQPNSWGSHTNAVTVNNGFNYIKACAYNQGGPAGFIMSIVAGGSQIANTNSDWALTTSASYDTGAQTYNNAPTGLQFNVSGLQYAAVSSDQFPSVASYKVAYITGGTGTLNFTSTTTIKNIFLVGGGAGGDYGTTRFPGLGGSTSYNDLNIAVSASDVFSITIGNGGGSALAGSNTTISCSTKSINYTANGGVVASNTNAVTGYSYSYNGLYYGGSGGSGLDSPTDKDAPLGGGGGGAGNGSTGNGGRGGNGGGISTALKGGIGGQFNVGISSFYGGGGGGGGSYRSKGYWGGAGNFDESGVTGGGVGGQTLSPSGSGGSGGKNTGGGGGGGTGDDSMSFGGRGGSGIVIIIFQ